MPLTNVLEATAGFRVRGMLSALGPPRPITGVRPMTHLVFHFTLLFALVCGCASRRSPDESLYKRFLAHDKSYFIKVATECDSVLRQHPIGSAGLRLSTNAPDWFVLTADSLPATLDALKPKKIMLTTNQIWVGFGGNGQLDWGIMWEQANVPDTNVWALRSCIAYGFEKTLYVTSKP